MNPRRRGGRLLRPIVAVGDSLTYGANSTTPERNSFPAVLGNSYSPFRPVANLGVGGWTSTQIRTDFLARPGLFGATVLIWAGRNNYADPTTVKADIAAMVAACTGSYVVMSILNGNRTNERVGQSNYAIITALNADLATLYGPRFLDIRSLLVAAYNPAIPQDVQDHTDDIPPTSLSADGLHLNDAGYALVAGRVRAALDARGW